jgi:PEP-CTERM motif
MMTQPSKYALVFVCLLLWLTMTSTCKADSLFNGIYDVGNWTTTLTNSDGAVDTSSAPDFITMVGGDNGSGGPGEILFSMIAPHNDSFAFNWTYLTFDFDGSAFDPAGYEIDGVKTQLSPSSSEFGFLGSGVTTVNLTSGESFGFYVDSTDNDLGPAILQVSAGDSTSVPEPSTLALLIIGAMLFGVIAFQHRQRLVVVDRQLA